MRRRPILLIGCAALAGTVLTGCEKPDPGITAFSGTQSVRSAALCWTESDSGLQSGQCAQDIVSGDQLGAAPELRVQPGNVLGISVDTSIAERGWVPAVGGQRLVNEPITETYFRFTFPSAQLPPEGLGLQVLAGTGNRLQGVWAIRLVS